MAYSLGVVLANLGVLAQAIIVGLLQSAPTPSAPVASNPASQVLEIVKLLAVAVPGYLVARRQAKKEEQTGQEARAESLVAGFKSMSLQAREQLTTAYEDTARERAARIAAEARVEELERELERRRKAEGADQGRGGGR